MRSLLLVVALLVTPILATTATAETIPGQLIIHFAPGASASSQAAAHQANGASVDATISQLRRVVVRVAPGREAQALGNYRRRGDVVAAEQDVVAQVATADTYWNRQWGLDNTASTVHLGDGAYVVDADIDGPAAWTYPLAAPVKVAVLDTGVDQDHEDLAGRLVANKNFAKGSTVDDKYGHGTHVAGTIAAIPNNNKGVAGVAPQVSLINAKVLGDNGSGSCSSIANGITWATDQGAKIISMSLGGGYCSAEDSAITYATNKGALVIAAAGNSATSSITNSYPGAFANAVGVAATNDSDALASFSNYGAWVDIAAPGVDIVSTLPNHSNRLGVLNYGILSGTSMATPHVSGVAALIAGGLSDLNGNGRTNDELRNRLLTSADNLSSLSAIGGGRLNACRAISSLASC